MIIVDFKVRKDLSSPYLHKQEGGGKSGELQHPGGSHHKRSHMNCQQGNPCPWEKAQQTLFFLRKLKQAQRLLNFYSIAESTVTLHLW